MKDYKRTFNIAASPEEVYAALTNPVTLELWTGEPAIMETTPGTEFSLWGGSIAGLNLEFVPGKKIVQEWYFGEQPKPSIVTLTLREEGKNTSVEVEHTNIPDEAYEEIADGWPKYYFRPLMTFYKE